MRLPRPFRTGSNVKPMETAPGFRHVHILDTAIGSDNLGDEIIVDSAKAALDPLVRGDHITTSSSHDGLGDWSRPSVAAADMVFLLGTNALSPTDQQAPRRYIWTVRPEDVSLMEGKVVLLGCGANRYFDRIEPRQADLLGRLLSAQHVHSVRDQLGAQIVEAAGHRAINTSCPTLWRYADDRPELPRGKAPAVCFTLTKHKAGSADLTMVETLRALYETVYFWPQQMRDLAYLDAMPGGRDGITIVPPNLAAYDAMLSTVKPDVVGTRLHGSIRGLHHGCRALVIAIDNRAAQIGEETGLPILMRDRIGDDLAERLNADFAKVPQPPAEAIRTYLAQLQAEL